VSVVKFNVLTVSEEMRAELERRFAGRAGLVESAEGFEHFELLRPVEGTDRYLVYTRWQPDGWTNYSGESPRERGGLEGSEESGFRGQGRHDLDRPGWTHRLWHYPLDVLLVDPAGDP